MKIIDADKLEDAFLKNARIIDNSELDEYAGRGLNCYEFKKLLDEQPTVEEKPKGKWIDDEFVSLYGIPLRYYKCTCCNKKSELRFDFCPNCGAYMRGEE